MGGQEPKTKTLNAQYNLVQTRSGPHENSNVQESKTCLFVVLIPCIFVYAEYTSTNKPCDLTMRIQVPAPSIPISCTIRLRGLILHSSILGPKTSLQRYLDVEGMCSHSAALALCPLNRPRRLPRRYLSCGRYLAERTSTGVSRGVLLGIAPNCHQKQRCCFTTCRNHVAGSASCQKPDAAEDHEELSIAGAQHVPRPRTCVSVAFVATTSKLWSNCLCCSRDGPCSQAGG